MQAGKLKGKITLYCELELLRKKFEAEKLLIDNQFKSDLKMLKNRKKEAMAELKAEYRKKRALLRKK